jgi:hypothetical protein
VKESLGDEACEEFVVPDGYLAPQTHGVLVEALRMRLYAMCLMMAKLAGA